MDSGGRSGVPEEPSIGARRYIRRLGDEALFAGRSIAFDSSALISYIEDQPPYAQLLEFLLIDGRPGVVISSVTVAETLVIPARDQTTARIEIVRQAIFRIPGIITIPLDDDAAVETAIVRARTGLKLPDSAIIAAALLGNAYALIGNDRIWKNRDLGIPYHHLDDILAE